MAIKDKWQEPKRRVTDFRESYPSYRPTKRDVYTCRGCNFPSPRAEDFHSIRRMDRATSKRDPIAKIFTKFGKNKGKW